MYKNSLLALRFTPSTTNFQAWYITLVKVHCVKKIVLNAAVLTRSVHKASKMTAVCAKAIKHGLAGVRELSGGDLPCGSIKPLDPDGFDVIDHFDDKWDLPGPQKYVK